MVEFQKASRRVSVRVLRGALGLDGTAERSGTRAEKGIAFQALGLRV